MHKWGERHKIEQHGQYSLAESYHRSKRRRVKGKSYACELRKTI